MEVQLTEDQQNASDTFTEFLLDEDSKFMVIEGYAGTGKTTLVQHLLKSMKTKMKMYNILLGKSGGKPKEFEVLLTATTNKAAVVLSELSNRPVGTIHSTIGLRPRQNWKTGELTFVKDEDYQIYEGCLFVIDEGSFINDSLLQDIDEATPNCKVLIIGDQYQLAPVNQLIPVMDTVEGTRVTLDKIMRHGGAIAEAGAKYREAVTTGIFPKLKPNGTDIIHVDGATFKQMIDETFLNEDYLPTDGRILAWTNFRVQEYNDYIRSKLKKDATFEEGEILVTNKPISYKVKGSSRRTLAFTDEMLVLSHIYEEKEERGILGRMVSVKDRDDLEFFLPNNPMEVAKKIKGIKAKKDWPSYFYIQDNWLDLRPVYSSTIHKSQGSTYEKVFIDLSDIGKCNIPSDVARMMYVAITRAAKQVILYGELPPGYRGK